MSTSNTKGYRNDKLHRKDSFMNANIQHDISRYDKSKFQIVFFEYVNVKPRKIWAKLPANALKGLFLS